MKLDLSPIINGRYDNETFTATFEFDAESGQRIGAKEISPIRVEGKVEKKDDKLFASGHYEGCFTFDCDRCLKKVNKRIEDDFKTRLITEDQEELVGYVMEKETLEIVDLVSDEILANMPFQILCDEDCLGLCANCGMNLNDGECDCDDTKIDPRFEKLKDLFTE